MWPGFSENMRVLKWIVERVHRRVGARESDLGWMPTFEDLDWSGSTTSHAEFELLVAIDVDAWHRELAQHREWFDRVGAHLPKELASKHAWLSLRLSH